MFALNWSMGMVGDGSNFFNFSLSIGLTLHKLNMSQILKFSWVVFWYIKVGRLKSYMKAF